MERHPSAISDASGAAEESPSGHAPYAEFLAALRDLSDRIELFGAGSQEVAAARRRVDRMRESAIAAWREEHVLAA